MLEQLLSFLPTQKSRDTAMTAAGMAALLAGRKVVALGLFSRGIYGLEQGWRAANPDFKGTWGERWEKAINFYESTHVDSKNRLYHQIGIPMIAGGAIGLLAFRPFRAPWFTAAGAFAAGWALNLVGHYKYEGNAPAFGDDPLSFIAGPVWDAKHTIQMFQKKRAQAAQKTAAEPSENGHNKGPEKLNGVHAVA
jgi:hypothetical protein